MTFNFFGRRGAIVKSSKWIFGRYEWPSTIQYALGPITICIDKFKS